MDGIEMNRKDFRKKHDIKTKFRIIGTCYGNFDKNFVVEHDEVVISSDTFSYEDYLEIRFLGFMFFAVFNLNFQKWFFQFARHLGINPSDFFSRFVKPDRSKKWPQGYIRFLDYLKRTAEGELYDTRDEMVAGAKKIYKQNGNEVGEHTKLNLNAKAVVLTRNPNAYQEQSPHISSNPSIRFHVGDVRDFEFPEESFSHIIHGATTSATETFNKQDPLLKYDTITEGTRHVLDFAVHCNCEKFLLISSASAYGKQPSKIFNVSEDYNGAPYTVDKNFDYSVLGEAKRASEMLTTIYSDKYGIETKIARCYTFVGPYLPLNIHYAIGNFIRDALNGVSIKINSNGTQRRSYMYTSDLTTWLWTILFRGENQPNHKV